MSNYVVVGRYSFPHEAQIARASLESAGIPARIADEHTINMNWLYSNALGGVKVLVPAEKVAEAEALLSSDFSSDVDAEQGSTPLACRACGSSNVAPYTKGKRPAFVVWLLLGFPLFFYQHGFRCESCGKFWKDETI